MQRVRVVLTGLALALLASGCGSGDGVTDADGEPAQASPTASAITVAGASDLRLAFEELGAAFEAETGTSVTFSFGSSGQLAQQIINGAPFDVFASANVAYVDDVISAGKAEESTKATYAFGRIVVYSHDASPGAMTTVEGLTASHVRVVAIANPEHAPYGAAAAQALRSAGIYDDVEPRLVFGENVSDTLRLATTGNADVAIVALSLVINSTDGAWALVDKHLHEPLEQALVVTDVDPARADAARAFATYINSPAGRAVMNRYGFLLPDEEAA